MVESCGDGTRRKNDSGPLLMQRPGPRSSTPGHNNKELQSIRNDSVCVHATGRSLQLDWTRLVNLLDVSDFP